MNENKPKQDDEISLKELIQKAKEWFDYLLSQWKIIVVAGIIGAALGLTYSFIKKPVYTATLSFALEDEKSGGLGGALGLASSFGLDLGGSGGGVFTASNLTELFKSRSMVEKTLLSPVVVDEKTISLAEMYIKNNEWRKRWDNKPDLVKLEFLPYPNRQKFTRVQDSILGVIYNDLSKSA
ncbi:MAG: Wzz/FepE/Etk N-terminal domain-containing protein, partial [Flavobacterium sp.]